MLEDLGSALVCRTNGQLQVRQEIVGEYNNAGRSCSNCHKPERLDCSNEEREMVPLPSHMGP